MDDQELFGSDSDNSEGEMKKDVEAASSQLPSTQDHMDDLFGESDDEEGQKSPATTVKAAPGSDDDDDQSDEGETGAPAQHKRSRTTSYESGGTPVQEEDSDGEGGNDGSPHKGSGDEQRMTPLNRPVVESKDDSDLDSDNGHIEAQCQQDVICWLPTQWPQSILLNILH